MHTFKHTHWHTHANAHKHQHRQKDKDGTHHSGLVVVFTRRQGRHAGSLSSRVKERGADLAVGQFLREIDTVLLLGKLAGLLVGVQSTKTVAGSTSAPVFATGQHHGVLAIRRGAATTNALAEPAHPVLGLVVIGGADDGHIEGLAEGHGRHGLFKSFRHGRFVGVGLGLELDWVGQRSSLCLCLWNVRQAHFSTRFNGFVLPRESAARDANKTSMDFRAEFCFTT